MTHNPEVPGDGSCERSPEEMIERSRGLYERMRQRRSVRRFSASPVPRSVIEHCLATAGTAPSGAHQQPWHFAAVQDAALKAEIRRGAESCERAFYDRIRGTAWARALEPLATGPEKPFLTEAPWLIVVFAQRERVDTEGLRQRHVYVTESVGIAVGLLITALHCAGLATLVYTPSPTTFLNALLRRPSGERALCILPVGFPHVEARVPDLSRKTLDDISSWF